MMAARGMPVTYLRRIAEGGLVLGGLEKGAVEELDIAQAEHGMHSIL